jgi:hypothetical protein
MLTYAWPTLFILTICRSSWPPSCVSRRGYTRMLAMYGNGRSVHQPVQVKIPVSTWPPYVLANRSCSDFSAINKSTVGQSTEWLWRVLSSGVWRRVVWYKYTDVFERYSRFRSEHRVSWCVVLLSLSWKIRVSTSFRQWRISSKSFFANRPTLLRRTGRAT